MKKWTHHHKNPECWDFTQRSSDEVATKKNEEITKANASERCHTVWCLEELLDLT